MLQSGGCSPIWKNNLSSAWCVRIPVGCIKVYYVWMQDDRHMPGVVDVFRSLRWRPGSVLLLNFGLGDDEVFEQTNSLLDAKATYYNHLEMCMAELLEFLKKNGHEPAQVVWRESTPEHYQSTNGVYSKALWDKR